MGIGVSKTTIAIGLATMMGLASSAYSAERPGDRPKDDSPRYSERARKSEWERGKEELKRALKAGEDRDFYRKELDKLGYQITAINYDKPDYVEYEVVKGDQTWEIQLGLDKNGRKVTKVDVSSNMWQAETTDQILKGKKVSKKDSPKGNARYSDRDRKGKWEKGKEELVRSLKVGEERDFYRKELEKKGYQITSVNSDKPEYAEYEIVKGDQTFEVQIDFDKNSRKATKVDVDTNVWKAEATEKALQPRQAKK